VKVLLDHCVPRPFAKLLVGHDVATCKERGWSDLKNGELLVRAAEDFGAFVTIDKSLAQQQNRQDLPLPVITIRVVDNRVETLASWASEVLKLLGQALQKRVYVVGNAAD
jgi:predicted nuclease of predicted toxin-antitoxin system